MSHAIAMLLLTLGCAPASFTGSNGSAFVVWVCPPVQGGMPLPARPAPQPEQPEEREG